MHHPRLLCILTACLLVFALLAALKTAGGAAAVDGAFATATPTTTTVPPVFTATASVVPSVYVIGVGEWLRVDVDLTVSAGCRFAVYESTLDQRPVPLLRYIDPPTATVGPPGALGYLLSAEQTGTVTFAATLYGERYCSDFWAWTYVRGKSAAMTVTVEPQLGRTYLPLLRGDLASPR